MSMRGKPVILWRRAEKEEKAEAEFILFQNGAPMAAVTIVTQGAILTPDIMFTLNTRVKESTFWNAVATSPGLPEKVREHLCAQNRDEFAELALRRESNKHTFVLRTSLPCLMPW